MDLQQQLMEFVYGLFDEDEANALRERITSDPAVARAYAKVKLQCDLVGRAARIETPVVAWTRPEGDDSSDTSPQPPPLNSSTHAHRRLANWCVGVAASGLICLVGSTYWMSSRPTPSESTPVAFAAAMPVKVVLTGPSKLHAEAKNPFTVRVESQAGTPVSTTLNYRVYDAKGVVSWQDSASTDRSGLAQFDVEGAVARSASRLEITPTDDSPAPILRELAADPQRFVTYLRMDRPLYQPGEQLFYRSVTLSQFGLRAEKEVSTSFDIVDENDAPIIGAAKVVETEHGVGSGAVTLPSDLPDGKYMLLARSPDNLFREEWRDFQVRRYETPRLFKKLELARDSYTAGEQVDLDFSVERVAGKPLADVALQVQATLDGESLPASGAKTDAEGKSRVSLTLPESIERGRASVSVTVKEGDDPAETITKEIPINLGKLNVDFYPEGGELAADLPSRVYFYGRDPLGKPAHIEGRVVDANNNKVADVVTTHEGRGLFFLTPAAGEQYRLLIHKPVGVTKELPLPIASSERFATLETGAGVFEANAPVAFTISQRLPAKPLLVAAYCRGAMVAQQTIEPAAHERVNDRYATFNGELSMSAEAQGVIRLTLFDGTVSPPTPIAERLVYRRVGQRLDVQLTPDAETFVPGQSVRLNLRVHDENDVPVPAVLGIAIVDDAVLNLADDKSTRMPTYFHLLTELDSAEQFEDANFYLSDEPESVTALDSLLGTQGWRRFTAAPEAQFAQMGGDGFGGGLGGSSNDFAFLSGDPRSRYRSTAWTRDAVVPLSTSTTIEGRERAMQRMSKSGHSPLPGQRPFASAIIIGSVGLLIMICLASLRHVGGNRSLLISATAVALGSLLIGMLSLPLNTLHKSGEVASKPIAVGGTLDEVDSIAASEAVEMSEDPAGGSAESFMYGADQAATLSDAPAAATPLESGPAIQPEITRKAAARYGASSASDAAVADAERATRLPMSKEKKSEPPLPEAQPAKAAAPSPAPPAPNDAGGQRLAMAEQPQAFADKDENRALRREYANWSFEPRTNAQSPEQSSTTIFWHPLFIANESGTATIYFNLPQRPSSFRAIVEAHGADRLGAGELLINSQ
jgi:hypothetical protein